MWPCRRPTGKQWTTTKQDGGNLCPPLHGHVKPCSPVTESKLTGLPRRRRMRRGGREHSAPIFRTDWKFGRKFESNSRNFQSRYELFLYAIRVRNSVPQKCIIRPHTPVFNDTLSRLKSVPPSRCSANHSGAYYGSWSSVVTLDWQ